MVKFVIEMTKPGCEPVYMGSNHAETVDGPGHADVAVCDGRAAAWDAVATFADTYDTDYTYRIVKLDSLSALKVIALEILEAGSFGSSIRDQYKKRIEAIQ